VSRWLASPCATLLRLGPGQVPRCRLRLVGRRRGRQQLAEIPTERAERRQLRGVLVRLFHGRVEVGPQLGDPVGRLAPRPLGFVLRGARGGQLLVERLETLAEAGHLGLGRHDLGGERAGHRRHGRGPGGCCSGKPQLAGGHRLGAGIGHARRIAECGSRGHHGERGADDRGPGDRT
jgi:hypothetical protein